MAAKLKTGDSVVVVAGKDAGTKGTINSVDPQRGKAVVSGVNVAVRHTKPQGGQQGGRIAREMPIDLSNLMYVDPDDGRGTRVGFRTEDGRKVRFAKRSGRTIDG